MAQRDLDLLPDSIRARSRAHVRTGRLAITSVVLFAAACAVVAWSRFAADRARTALRGYEAHATEVLTLEARALQLRGTLEEKRSAIERYHQIELPVQVSAVVASVINDLPDSVTLDEIAVDAGYRRSARTPRSTGAADEKRDRLLTVELTGFALTDAEIAELVDRLTAQPPFQDVNLDFSRSRFVRERSAREFRLSFRVDLEPRYEVTLHDPEPGRPAGGTAVAVEASDDIP